MDHFMPSSDTLHLCNIPKRKWPSADRISNRLFFVSMTLIAGIIFLVAKAFATIGLVMDIKVLAWLNLVVFLIGALVYLVRWYGRRWHARRGVSGDCTLCASSRLVCVGCTFDEQERELISRGMFEPELFKSYGATTINAREALLLLPATVLGFFLATLLFGLTIIDLFAIKLWLGIGIGHAIVWFVFPTIIRITPTKLEILRYGPLFSQSIAHESFDLTTAQIIVDEYWRMAVIIQDDSHRIELSTILLDKRNRFIISLFRSAMSSYHPPELGTDKLIG